MADQQTDELQHAARTGGRLRLAALVLLALTACGLVCVWLLYAP
jgi:hypothetical protein